MQLGPSSQYLCEIRKRLEEGDIPPRQCWETEGTGDNLGDNCLSVPVIGGICR